MAAAVKQTLEEWKTKLEKCLNEKNKCNDVLGTIETKTGVKRLNIVLALVALLSLYLMVGYGCDFLCNFIGFLYPAYASIKAIESREKDDDTKWLTYWVVYSFFSLLEFFTDICLFWIPFYWFFKCVFLVYCMAPVPNNGAVTIYYKIIRPYFLKHESKIDSGFNKAKDVARTAYTEAETLARDSASDVFKRQVGGDSTKNE